MWIFKKRKQEEKVEGHRKVMSDKVAGGIARFLILIQVKFAKVMNNSIGKLPLTKMKVILVCFCLISGGLSIYFIVDALFNKNTSQPTYTVDPINVPKHFDRVGDDFVSPDYTIGEEVITRVLHFERYMDSLRVSSSGKIIYDSIVSARPGLLDSVAMIKMMYQQERINK